jgi:hypothetical protein
MRFQKIKYDKGKVKIEYELRNKAKNDWDQFSLACSDEPKPEFQTALQALSEDVIRMCELPEDYQKRIMVTGVSFSYGGDGEVMGATIVSQMALYGSNVNLNLNTPHKSSEPYSEGGDASQCLSTDCIEHLTSLMLEAEDYVTGKRAQGELFEDKEKAKEEGLKKIAKEFYDDMKKGLGPGESVTISSEGHSATIKGEGRA